MREAAVLRSAFWSGRMTYRRWRGLLREGPERHPQIFVQAFVHMPVSWLLREITKERLIRLWPRVREQLSSHRPEEKVAREAWDALWGVLATGDAQYPVRNQVASLSRKRRELLKVVVQHPGISLYGLAKMTGRDYSRVYKDVQFLVRLGEVQLLKNPHSPRRVTRIFPVHSINTQLVREALPHP